MKHRAPVIVWGGGCVCLLVTIWYVATYASYFPHADDWEAIPFTAGPFDVTLEWLWSPHNEHRIPLPRLLWIGLAKVFGGDPRVLIWFDVVLLAATCAILVRTARELRGRTVPVDLLIPLALLSLGQYRNLLWAFQIMWFVPVLLFAVCIRSMVGRDGGVRPALVAGGCTVLMILCGGPGLLLAVPVIAWTLVRGGELFAQGRQRCRAGAVAGAVAVLATGLAAVTVTVLYCVDLGRGGDTAPVRPAKILAGCIDFLTIGVGPAGGRDLPGIGLALGALWCIAALAAGIVWLRRRRCRPVAFALLTMLGAVAGMTVVISWGRGPRTEGATWVPRYTLAASLVVVALHLVAASFGMRWVPRAVSAALIGLVLWRMPANVRAAVDWGEHTESGYQALEADIRAGTPAMTVARRHYPAIFDNSDSVRRVFYFLVLMHHMRWGPFRDGTVGLNLAPENLVAREIPLDPVHKAETSWDGRQGVATGPDAQLWFALDAPAKVAEVRLHLAVQNGSGRARAEILWTRRGAGQGVAQWDHTTSFWHPTGTEPQPVTISLGGHEMDVLRIDPDNRLCTFRIERITLMVLAD